MTYDLIVIGAGPSGLMTAKIAAHHGLKVLMVDLKKKLADNLRLCAAVLYIKPGFHGDSEVLEEGRIIFVENDFSVRYDGGYHPLWEWGYVSPGGYRFRMGKKNYPAAWALDKQVLIKRMLEDALAAGVTFWNESAALKVDNGDEGVKVLIRKQFGEPGWLTAGKCVVSDGIASRTTQVSFPRVWKARKHLAAANGVGYMATGLASPWGNNIFALCKNRFGSAYFVPTPRRSPEGEIIWQIIGLSTDPETKQENARRALHCLMNEAPLGDFFKNVNILARTGCAWDFYTPIYDPVVENCLLVGDVCAMQEVDIQGALACGFRAGHAVKAEIEGKAGFRQYAEWWNRAFEFNQSDDPARHLAQGFGLFALGADVLDYWFSLMEGGMINAFIDHNRLGALLEAGYKLKRDQIQAARPEIAEKLDDYFSISAEEAYKGVSEDVSNTSK